ncbi:MAG TPA: lysylphosphatidylglycerol synthase transmembrane domain-containing protein [Vicinamibacterales bacterium]|jgi:uncharacterized protein (TIRG00374 family)|nr:lysylphosphatidylglycerol synthase transmembrane domain-containing protein [Vicinamibacterales bacterium]
MQRHLRTLVVLSLGAGLVALFLRQVDLATVGREIKNAQPLWLGLSLASMYLNLAIRSMRWQYLLAPMGRVRFRNAFRATTVGFGARGVLPSAIGELVRPYFLSRHEPISAASGFATIVVERILDLLTILMMLAAFVFIFGRELAAANPAGYSALQWTAGTAGIAALVALAFLFALAGRPHLLLPFVRRIESLLPARLAGVLEALAHKFVIGLSAIGTARRLLAAFAWSVPLWLCIGFGVWGVTEAFRLNIPFTGSFLLIAFLTIGITVPTPGAVGGFHEAFRLGATQFFAAPEGAAVGAAIVLHAISIGSSLILGLIFAAQAGLNLSAMRELVTAAESGEATSLP